MAAVTTGDGIRGWWCADADVDEHAGGEVHLRFQRDGMTVPMDFRVDSIGDSSVAWTCTANANPAWPGTTLTWSFSESGDGVALDFEHGGWSDAGVPEDTSAVWPHFMASLEAFLATGSGMPG